MVTNRQLTARRRQRVRVSNQCDSAGNSATNLPRVRLDVLEVVQVVSSIFIESRKPDRVGVLVTWLHVAAHCDFGDYAAESATNVS